MNPLTDWKLNKNILPDSPALLSKDTSITYSQLENYVNSRAASFFNQNVREKDMIAVISENNRNFIINIFALWTLGAVPVLINLRLTDDEKEDLINNTRCKFLVMNEEQSRGSTFNNRQILNYTDDVIAANTDRYVVPGIYGTAVIIFTSGSSGKPKGVELSFSNLINSAETGDQVLKQSAKDRWLASLPFYHIGGFSIITRTVLAGASVILPVSLRIEDLIESINNHQPTHTSLVPTQLVRLINSGIMPNAELRKVLLGGGFIEEELIHKALSYGWEITKVYGSTETASFVTALDCTENIKLKSAGKALAPNTIVIVDNEKKVLPLNYEGEIAVQSNSIAKGYINNPDETEKKFCNGIYYTGDIGYLDEEKYLYISAKRTDLIISGGENVNPVEVENILLKHPGILEAAVFGIEDKEWGHAVAAAVKTDNKTQITIDHLKNFLNGKIAGYKIPKRLYIVAELPKSSLGKIQREKLKDLVIK